MNFNYLDSYITQSPLDFNYQFGINNNTPDKFNYNEISVLTNTAITMINNESPMLSLPTMLVSATNLLDDNVGEFEIVSISNSLSWNNPLDTTKLDKIRLNNFDIENFISSIMNHILAFGSTLSNVSSATNINPFLQGTNGEVSIWNRETMSFDNNSVSASDGFILGYAAIQLTMSAVNMGFSWKNRLENEKTKNKLLQSKIDLMNENITANNEFMEQAKQVIQDRQRRFEKSSRIINT